MNDREAMQAMLDGKKITKRDSDPRYVLWFSNQELTSTEGFGPFFRGSDADESVWKIYEEPKPEFDILSNYDLKRTNELNRVIRALVDKVRRLEDDVLLIFRNRDLERNKSITYTDGKSHPDYGVPTI